MPNTLSGLLLFVALLAPGIIYSAARSLRYPERETSTLRETGGTVLVSVACIITVLALFALVRAVAPDATPNIGRTVRGTDRYRAVHYRELLTWGLALFAAACLLALALARWLPEGGTKTHNNSAWVRAFAEEPRLLEESGTALGFTHVGIELVDGSYVGGYLRTYAHTTEETGDRDLFLVAPITYREDAGALERNLDEVGGVVVSARQMKFVAVAYLREQEGAGGVAEQAKH